MQHRGGNAAQSKNRRRRTSTAATKCFVAIAVDGKAKQLCYGVDFKDRSGW